jgi:hypothetical protein
LSDTKLRKIGFYTIELRKYRSDETLNPILLKDVIEYILSKEIKERITDGKESKFRLLRSAQFKDKIHKLLFTSAEYNKRPNLIDRQTAADRESPKKMSEGEDERTHVLLKYGAEEIIVITEERRNGLSITSIVNYLKEYYLEYRKENPESTLYRITYSIIPKDDFLGELKKLERVRIGDVFIDKQILGSEFLNFSDKITQSQQEIVLSIKAQKGQSIKSMMIEIYNRLNGETSRIKKLRISGNNEDGNPVLLDTDLIKKIEYIEAAYFKTTGELRPSDVFLKLEELSSEV